MEFIHAVAKVRTATQRKREEYHPHQHQEERARNPETSHQYVAIHNVTFLAEKDPRTDQHEPEQRQDAKPEHPILDAVDIPCFPDIHGALPLTAVARPPRGKMAQARLSAGLPDGGAIALG